VRAQPNFLNRINLFLPVQSPSAKIFRFPFPPNHLYHAHHPGPREGRIAIVTDVGCGMRWTRQRLAGEGSQGGFFESVSDALSTRTRDVVADGQIVWS